LHRGDLLRQELVERRISVSQFAPDLHIPKSRASSILNGKRAITADTALRLSRYFGTSPEMWLKLQNTYDLAAARLASGDKISREVIPAR
jgi:addiction module HigA family antidote